MKLKSLLLTSAVLLAQIAFAQVPNLPSVSELEGTDGSDYNDDARLAAEYIVNNEYEDTEDDIKSVNAFLMAWAAVSSDVSIKITSPKMLQYGDDNGQLMMVFIAAWTLNTLDHPEQKNDAVANAVAAFQIVFDHYEMNEDEFDRSNEIRDLGKLIRRDELQEWVEELVEAN